MGKLSQDQVEDLQSTIQTDGFKVLMGEIEKLTEVMESRVISTPIDPTKLQEILTVKAEAQGARKLLEAVRARIAAVAKAK